MPPRLLLLLLTLVANDPELLEEFVAVDDDVAVGQPGNLTDLLFLKCIDELQIHVSVAGASVQCGALLSNPLGNGILFNHRGASSLLLLDEVSEGLAPVIVQKLTEVILQLKQKGFTIVLVEQNFRFAAPLADRMYVVERGRIVLEIARDEIKAKQELLEELLAV